MKKTNLFLLILLHLSIANEFNIYDTPIQLINSKNSESLISKFIETQYQKAKSSGHKTFHQDEITVSINKTPIVISIDSLKYLTTNYPIQPLQIQEEWWVLSWTIGIKTLEWKFKPSRQLLTGLDKLQLEEEFKKYLLTKNDSLVSYSMSLPLNILDSVYSKPSFEGFKLLEQSINLGDTIQVVFHRYGGAVDTLQMTDSTFFNRISRNRISYVGQEKDELQDKKLVFMFYDKVLQDYHLVFGEFPRFRLYTFIQTQNINKIRLPVNKPSKQFKIDIMLNDYRKKE